MPDIRADAAQSEPLALYIHWPFCVSKCPYCDFNSHVRESLDQSAWRDALLADLAHEADATPGRSLGSIFFGGGTPSLMPPATVADLIAAASNCWRFEPEIEITLEANPSSVEASRFEDLAVAGVNRISLGLQSLDDRALRLLGRAHDASEGLAALATAQKVFDRVSFDLIYALPGQSQESWGRELGRALGFETGHLSLYQLTIEPGTRFATLVRSGALAPMADDDAAALFELTQEACEAKGLPAYEISNHARRGEESRHNLAYWRYRDHAGIGPGAHGRRGGRRTQRHRKPENWLTAVAAAGHGIAEDEALTPIEQGEEALLMGLRLREGVELARIEDLSGGKIDGKRIARLADHGLVSRKEGRLRVTSAGRLLLNSILAELLA